EIALEIKREVISHRAIFESFIEEGVINELITLPNKELFLSKTGENELILNVGKYELTYTPEDFSQHVKETLDCLDKYPNYTISILPEAPFVDLKIYITKSHVTVLKKIHPNMILEFIEPRFARFFRDYFEALSYQYDLGKEEAKRILQRYL
ncbi:MAG: hypothetical protein HUJ56_13115, partial [Erysipelotrichaceae bacterium]|nr:hypothetical protein [Erysipelotrichaceae bacterium]